MASESERAKVSDAVRAAGYDGLEAFIDASTGKTLTEMAEEIGVPAQTLIRVHGAWVDEHAPPFFTD